MSISEFLNQRLINIDNIELTVFSLLSVVFVLIFTWLLLKFLKRIIEKPGLSKSDTGRKHSMYLILKYVVWVVSIVVILDIIGFKITILLAGSAALLVGLGLGIQQIFNDLASGIFLLFEGTVQVNDILEVDGMICRVKEIKLRTSVVVTKDEVVKIVPNHKFISETVTNWSRQEQQHARFRTVIGVSYKSDPKEIQKLLLEILQSHPDIIKKENCMPMVRFADFADSSINFELVFWSENIFRIDNVISDIRYQAFDVFRLNNIEIPFPQRDLHIKSGDMFLKSKD